MTFIEGSTAVICILLMQFDRHTASLLMGGGGAQTENIKVRGTRNLEHVQCAYIYESSMSSGVWGSCSPRRFAAYKRGRKGG